MNKTQVFAKIQEFANGEIGKGNLSDKQYNEIATWAKQIHDTCTNDVSRLAQGKALINLFEKLGRDNVINPRDEQAKRESNALASYNTAMAKGLAIWKMSLPYTPDEKEVIAKTAVLDSEYRARLAEKANQAKLRNEFIQSV